LLVQRERSENKKGKLEKPANHYKHPTNRERQGPVAGGKKAGAHTGKQDAKADVTAATSGMEGSRRPCPTRTVIGSGGWFFTAPRDKIRRQSADTQNFALVSRSDVSIIVPPGGPLRHFGIEDTSNL